MEGAYLVVLLPLLDKSPPVRPVAIIRPSLVLFPGAPRLQEIQKRTAHGSSVAGAVGAWRAYSTRELQLYGLARAGGKRFFLFRFNPLAATYGRGAPRFFLRFFR